ncbi:MAG: pyruvate, water dikinase [Deltaproteobacteria bacterium]|nr:pyruvate, water dikinase [Deltaproteobacteria bacterium]MBW2666503.1 pyruvate, water dikinase [Deltaproteobacteria bacterium]
MPDALVIVGASLGRLPADLERGIAKLGTGPLAVRSSAIGEDGEDASFAGQYETVLNVRGPEALREAIATCLASAESARALVYRDARDRENGDSAATMSVVVQRMVDARVSGVCFTADPVTSRRKRLVLDSVAGLGEALVSGHASPDHDELQRAHGVWEPTHLAGSAPVLSEGERELVAREALEAEARLGEPLDLEWAIDADGSLFWLQARPITTLGADPQGFDTPTMEPGDVYTRCNVGEMMPGAVSPLTFSTCARGIDVGWQDNMIELGVRSQRSDENVYIGMSYGHLFINLSAGVRFSAEILASDPDEQSLAICGRLVPEVAKPESPPLWVRLPRIAKQVLAVVRAKSQIRRMEALVEHGAIDVGPDSLATWRNLDAKLEDLYQAYARHLTVSSGAGALAPILLRILAGNAEPDDSHHAAVAHLFAGADGVESADIAAGAKRILDALVASEAGDGFANGSVEAAVAWLDSEAAGEAGRSYAEYLARHGHRSLRELDVRQPEWAHDPSPLIKALQTQLRGRLRDDSRVEVGSAVPPTPAPWFLRPFASIAHAAVRNRERSKSLLVATTVHFKRAYRALAAQLVAEGRLPDEDALYFLLHEELGELAAAPAGAAGGQAAISRRKALVYQQTLTFPEISVDLPEPEAETVFAHDERIVVGKPVSGGCVEGPVRVVLELSDAEALEPGEILVAPITDVGWTPYFAIIRGLVTDVGSAVSHGAVVAREYGLPAVLNTHNATRVLVTGDRVRLDGDRGTIEILD